MAEVTEQERQERKAYYDKRKKETNEAFSVVKAVVDASGNGEAVEALKTIRPSLYGVSGRGRTAGNSLADKIVEYVETNRVVTEMQMFKEFKAGPKEILAQLRNHLTKAEPSERRWIQHDPEKEEFAIVAKGKNPPKQGYSGYRPVEVEEVADFCSV